MDNTEASAPDGRVSFGPKPWQSVPPEAASLLLTTWRERQPAQFGWYLAEIMTGEPPRKDRGGAS